MALSPKQRKQLKATMKRRELRPTSSYQPPATLDITARERDRITKTNAAMLLAIETLILEIWNQESALDDQNVEQALISAIQQTELSGEGPAQKLAEAFRETSQRYSEGGETDEDWLMALRAILSSVRTHMEGPGSRYYLNFTERFIAGFHARQNRNR